MFAKQNCVYVSSAMKSELKQLFFTEKFQTIAFTFLVAHEKAHIHYRYSCGVKQMVTVRVNVSQLSSTRTVRLMLLLRGCVLQTRRIIFHWSYRADVLQTEMRAEL